MKYFIPLRFVLFGQSKQSLKLWYYLTVMTATNEYEKALTFLIQLKCKCKPLVHTDGEWVKDLRMKAWWTIENTTG